MAINDVRKFIEAIEKSGDLVRIKEEVDWDEEAGAIGRAGCENQGPAFLGIFRLPENEIVAGTQISVRGRKRNEQTAGQAFSSHELAQSVPPGIEAADGGALCQPRMEILQIEILQSVEMSVGVHDPLRKAAGEIRRDPPVCFIDSPVFHFVSPLRF